jgi:hypothetical protein
VYLRVLCGSIVCTSSTQRTQNYTKGQFTVPVLNLCPAQFILMIKDSNRDDESPIEQIRTFLL